MHTFTQDEIDEIHQMAADGYSEGEIARTFGVSQPTVSRRLRDTTPSWILSDDNSDDVPPFAYFTDLDYPPPLAPIHARPHRRYVNDAADIEESRHYDYVLRSEPFHRSAPRQQPPPDIAALYHQRAAVERARHCQYLRPTTGMPFHNPLPYPDYSHHSSDIIARMLAYNIQPEPEEKPRGLLDWFNDCYR